MSNEITGDLTAKSIRNPIKNSLLGYSRKSRLDCK
jgi:hypothetical protein